MSEASLLVLKTEQTLTIEQRDRLMRSLDVVASELDLKPIIADGGVEVGIHTDVAPLMRKMVQAQQETNQLLLMVLDALSDDGDEEDEPSEYLDGRPAL